MFRTSTLKKSFFGYTLLVTGMLYSSFSLSVSCKVYSEADYGGIEVALNNGQQVNVGPMTSFLGRGAAAVILSAKVNENRNCSVRGKAFYDESTVFWEAIRSNITRRST